jgi:hypothetical protein
MGTSRRVFWIVTFGLSQVTGGVIGCTVTNAPNTDVASGVSSEIKRICALPDKDRQAEIERVERESGVVIACGT